MPKQGKLLLAFALVSSFAFGWGRVGHDVTARIAEYYLTETTTKKLKALLASEAPHRVEAPDAEHPQHPAPIEKQAVEMPPFIALNWVSSWPDHLRPRKGAPQPLDFLWPLTRAWHYLNLPVEDQRMTVDAYCPGENCIVRRLQTIYAALRDNKIPYQIDNARDAVPAYGATAAQLVKFLVHFMGDVNQPLHICENDKDQDGKAIKGEDKGGNSRKVNFFGVSTIHYPDGDSKLSLHSVWDDKSIEKAMQHDAATHRPARREYGYAEDLKNKITPEQMASWKEVNFEKWAWESHVLAVEKAYKGINMDFNAVSVLGDEYYNMTLPIIESQLQKGGYTLSILLNSIYDPDFKI